MMKDYRAHLEVLRRQAAESTLISAALATVPQKRALFATLAVHLNTLAAEVERAMAAAQVKVFGHRKPQHLPRRRTSARRSPHEQP